MITILKWLYGLGIWGFLLVGLVGIVFGRIFFRPRVQAPMAMPIPMQAPSYAPPAWYPLPYYQGSYVGFGRLFVFLLVLGMGYYIATVHGFLPAFWQDPCFQRVIYDRNGFVIDSPDGKVIYQPDGFLIESHECPQRCP